MSDISEIFEYSKNKTRVLVLSSIPSVAKLLKKVLDFNRKDFDYFLHDGSSSAHENDFVIFETSDIENAATFHPNIVLVTDEIPTENLDVLLKNIVSGGVLIYPENFEETAQNSENYFRKLTFGKSEIQNLNGAITLKTEMGLIPVNSKDENFLRNIEGIKLLSQQFGVMEEEFYEPVIGF